MVLATLLLAPLAPLQAADRPATPSGDGDLAARFRNPPSDLRPMPFWHINGELTPDGIRSQLRDSRDRSGFGGVAVLPVSGRKDRNGRVGPGIKPDYLSEDYFARYGDILDTARDLGMQVIFYDDINFPSGSAGGQMRKLYPGDCLKRLDKLEEDVTGPLAYSRDLPKDELMAAVAMNTQTLQRVDITDCAAHGKLAWSVPGGPWKIMLFVLVRNDRQLVDYLSPEACDKFFALTYDQYARRFKEHFGTTIRMTFFDDVSFFGHRSWTEAFNAKFQARYGINPAILYPALWYDIGPDTAAARVALFGFRSELMAKGYPSTAGRWAHAHNVKATGHPAGNYEVGPVDMAGDLIKFYEHSDYPLMDAIFYHGHGRPGYKLVSSAAYNHDQPVVPAEIYGAFAEKTMDPAMLYRAGMEVFARGINFIIPHGMWYNPDRVRIPPLIAHFSPKLAPSLPDYSRWVARCCLMLQGGRHIADIAMLYPIASLEAHYRFDAPDFKRFGTYVPPEADYLSVGEALTSQVRRDFTFLHPETLEAKCTLEGDMIRLNHAVNRETYRVMIMPGGKVIPWSSLRKIKAFYDQGGKVIATTCLPAQSAESGHDADVQSAVRAMFGDAATAAAPASAPGRVKIGDTDFTVAPYRTSPNARGGVAYFAPRPTAGTLQAILDEALPTADVLFPTDLRVSSGNGMLSYIHRQKDGRDIYFFANSSDTLVDSVVRLRGKLSLQYWNPTNGETSAAETTQGQEHGQAVTRLPIKLAPVSSLFVVTTP